MSSPSRRAIIASLSVFGLAPFISNRSRAGTRPRIVIIGGGFGGASAAHTFAMLAPHFQVTLIEPKAHYYACPFSNLVITGERPLSAQKFGYDNLKARGVEVVHALAENIDPDKKVVRTDSGMTFEYDRLILSPGIDFIWNAIEGYDARAALKMPHAWQAGPQTSLLAQQLSNMDDGGTVVISAPAAPYRCPPGPYERASLIAHFLKTQKPRSKLIILDAKENFSKQPLFEEAWNAAYPDIIEWRSASSDGRTVRVEPGHNRVFTDFETLNPAVANIIPPQCASEIAKRSGAADASGWCPINAVTFESKIVPNIHVIGDAAIAAPMPKSAYSANLQAKICAIQIIRLLTGRAPQPTLLNNTCYSYIDPQQAVSISGVYNNEGGTFNSVKDAGGVSPMQADISVRLAEGQEAETWFASITQEAFG